MKIALCKEDWKMDWYEFFKILADFIMKLVAFFKNSDGSVEITTK